MINNQLITKYSGDFKLKEWVLVRNSTLNA